MSRKIAMPVTNTGTLDGHFGHSKFFVFFTEEAGKIIAEETLVPPPHKPGAIPNWLVENGATEVIAAGIGQKAIKVLNSKGVEAIAGAPQIAKTEVLEHYLKNSLPSTGKHCNHDHGHGHQHQHQHQLGKGHGQGHGHNCGNH